MVRGVGELAHSFFQFAWVKPSNWEVSQNFFLSLTKRKLIIDVQTRRYSALDMFTLFLEQQATVYVAIT